MVDVAQKVRKTKELKLVLVGTSFALVTGCAPEPEVPVSRDYYASAQECRMDWSDDECEDVRYSSHSSYHHYGYYGPYYDRTSGRVYRLDGSTYHDPKVKYASRSTHAKSILKYKVPQSSLKYPGDGIYSQSNKAQARIAKSGNYSAFSNGRSSSSFGKAGFGSSRGSFGG
jgi:hypothetical protein